MTKETDIQRRWFANEAKKGGERLAKIVIHGRINGTRPKKKTKIFLKEKIQEGQ